jgi:uncharacterized protein YbaP (TraB family)
MSSCRTLARGLVCLILACWLAAAVAADDRFQRGLLFEVAAESGCACHLFGTIHSEDPRVLQLPQAARNAFEGAEVFVMETIPDAQAMIRSMMAMVYADGRTLKGVVGADLYARVLEALTGLGMTEEAVKDFKPWAVVTLLSLPEAQTGEFLDIRLYRAALADGKEVIGLESVEEQLAVFDDLSTKDQVSLLRETLEVLHLLPEVAERLLQVYLDRDLAGLLRLSDEYLRHGDARLAERFEEAALHVRNARMVDRLDGILREGDCFIAVGALHLPGPGGILERLQGRGYSVRAVF